MIDNAHWHVAFGIAGYGPDSAIDATAIPANDIPWLCDVIREEIATSQDIAHDGAVMAGDAGDYEEGYKGLRLVESLDVIRTNLGYRYRVSAPLYRGDVAALDASMLRIIAETFPLDVDVNGSTRLYVWECSETECTEEGDE